MRVTVGGWVLCLWVWGASGVESAPVGTGSHVWQMHKVSFIDSAASQPNLVAGTMLIPDGWTVRANGNYVMDCVFSPPRLVIAAGRADGAVGLSVYPGQVQAWSDNPQVAQMYRSGYPEFAKTKKCVVNAPQPLEASLREGLEFLKREPVSGVLPVPGLSEELRITVQTVNRQMAQQSGAGTLAAEAGRMRFKTQVAGKAFEGWLIMIVTTRTTPLPGGQGTAYLIDKPLICEMFAPAGELDGNDALLSAMLGTIQVDPHWQRYAEQDSLDVQRIMQEAYAKVANIHNQMMQDNLRTQQKIAAIRQGTAAYARNVYAHVASDRAAALDHSAQQFSLYMGDQAVYQNPATGERVQMNSGYGHAWASSSGSADYVVTDSASYDPNGKLGGGGWTELQQEH